ncbi:hypothetical protein AB0C89_29860 [Streptomyces sp. NPDC048491]|uniref:hypothetical protein n=1 Tax=Streptomyces sp. NPDC048491 TaxID=3157207 RepID=UPI00343FB09D
MAIHLSHQLTVGAAGGGQLVALIPELEFQVDHNAMCPAYVRVVSSAWSRPNRPCRRKTSASGTTAKSSSITVHYRTPDGS